MITLQEFMESSYRSSHIDHPEFETLYVRKAKRLIQGKLERTFVIATIEAYHTKRGAFTRLLANFRNLYPDWIIYVENVCNPSFAKHLAKIGFKVIPNQDCLPSFFLMGDD